MSCPNCEKWKAEAARLRDAKPEVDPDISDPATLEEIIECLKGHQWTHTDWATWFEGNPNDPRIKAIGNAAFHRKVEARYSRMIAGLMELNNSDTPESHGDSDVKPEQPQNPSDNHVSSTGGDLDDNKL